MFPIFSVVLQNILVCSLGIDPAMFEIFMLLQATEMKGGKAMQKTRQGSLFPSHSLQTKPSELRTPKKPNSLKCSIHTKNPHKNLLAKLSITVPNTLLKEARSQMMATYILRGGFVLHKKKKK